MYDLFNQFVIHYGSAAEQMLSLFVAVEIVSYNIKKKFLNIQFSLLMNSTKPVCNAWILLRLNRNA